MTYWFPPYFNRRGTRAKKNLGGFRRALFPPPFSRMEFAPRAGLTSSKASFTVFFFFFSGALIQTTCRPTSGLRTSAGGRTRFPIGCSGMGTRGVLVEKDNKHIQVGATTSGQSARARAHAHKRAFACINIHQHVWTRRRTQTYTRVHK